MKLNKKVLMASLFLASSVVGAENISFYGGTKINFSRLAVKDNNKSGAYTDRSGIVDEFTPIVGLGLGGGAKYNFDKAFIGGEVYVNYAFNKTKTKDGQGSENKLTYGLSEEVNFIFGRDLTKEFNIYGILGINNSKIKFKNNANSPEEKSKNNIAFQYGVGFTYNIDDNLSFKYQTVMSSPKYKIAAVGGNSEYTKKTLSATGSLGLTYTF